MMPIFPIVTLNQGHWNMSKARYAMGGQTLASHQYDMNMKTTVFFPMESLEDILMENDWSEDGKNKDVSGEQSEEEEEEKEKEPIRKDSNRQNEPENKVSSLGGVRKRKTGGEEKPLLSDSGDEVVEEEVGGSKLTKGSQGEKPKDPLNWFGVLVPPALRQSQKEFKDGNYRVPHKNTNTTKTTRSMPPQQTHSLPFSLYNQIAVQVVFALAQTKHKIRVGQKKYLRLLEQKRQRDATLAQD